MIDANEQGGRDKRRERTRQEILSAAAEVFARKGFHEASIQEIARVAELSAGSLYNYFDNKDALFNDLLEDVFANFQELLVEPSAELPFRDRLLGITRTLFQFGDDHRDHFRFFVLLSWSGGLVLGRDVAMQNRQRQFILGAFLHGFVDKATDQGQLPQQDVEQATLLVMSLLHGFAFRWFHGFGPDRLVDSAEDAVNLMLNGLRHSEVDSEG